MSRRTDSPRLARGACPASLVSIALLFVIVPSGACDREARGNAPPNVTLAPAAAPSTALRPKSPCPDDMALVTLEGSEVCVDRYEASLQGWSFSHPLDGTDAGAMHVVAAKGVKPQVNVSEEQAEAACEASSKRLCTSREWLAACRGPKDFTYPYGNEPIEGACNVGRPRPQVAIAGAEGGRIDDPKIAEADHTIEPCGSFPKCVSAFGVFDMHGNVHEWVSDDGSPSDPRFGMFLGGYFADGSENGAGCMYKTTAHFKSYHDYSTGFRCCRDAAR